MFTTTQTGSKKATDASFEMQSALPQEELKTLPLFVSQGKESKRSDAQAALTPVATHHSMALDFDQPGSFTDKNEDHKTALVMVSASPADFRDKLLTEKEKEWRDKYFDDAVKAINEGDIVWLTLILGQERYYAWMEYLRHKHESHLPRYSMFFTYALDFIRLYEEKPFSKLYDEKLQLDAQFKEYKKITRIKKINEEMKNEKELTASQPGLLDPAMHEVKCAVQADPVCLAYEEALKAYEEGGIFAYSDRVSAIKGELEGIEVYPDANHLRREQFNYEMRIHIHRILRQELEQVKSLLNLETEALAKARNKSINMAGYKERYRQPFLKQYVSHMLAFFDQFTLNQLSKTPDFIGFSFVLDAFKEHLQNKYEIQLQKEKEKQEKFLKHTDKYKIRKTGHLEIKLGELKQNKDTKESTYFNAARDVYKDQAGYFRATVEQRYRNHPKFNSSGLMGTVEFLNDMVELRFEMGLDVFDIMVDAEGRTLIYHAFHAYRRWSPEERIQRMPIINALLKQGCSPYPYTADPMIIKARKALNGCDAFAYANSQNPKVKDHELKDENQEHKLSEDHPRRDLPDWAILASMLEYNILALSEAQDSLRSFMLDFSIGKEGYDNPSLFLRWVGYFWDWEEIVESRRKMAISMTESLYQATLLEGDADLIHKADSSVRQLLANTALGWSDLRDGLTHFVDGVGDVVGKGQLIGLPSTQFVPSPHLKRDQDFAHDFAVNEQIKMWRQKDEEKAQEYALDKAALKKQQIERDRQSAAKTAELERQLAEGKAESERLATQLAQERAERDRQQAEIARQLIEERAERERLATQQAESDKKLEQMLKLMSEQTKMFAALGGAVQLQSATVTALPMLSREPKELPSASGSGPLPSVPSQSFSPSGKTRQLHQELFPPVPSASGPLVVSPGIVLPQAGKLEV